MADHLQPFSRTQIAVDTHATVMGLAAVALNGNAIVRTTGGAAAAAMGAANLARRDEARISTIGSFGQLAGGLTLALARHPEAVPRAAAAVVAGSLLNQVETRVASAERPVLRGALRGAIFTGATGIMLAGRQADPRTVLVMAGIGAGAAAMWALAAESSGPPRSAGGELGLRLRLHGR